MLKKRLLSILQYCFFLGLGIFLVWWSINKMGTKNWADCKAALRSANYYLFIPVFFILVISHISRTIRWKILMNSMGHRPGFANTFFAVMIGYLANLAVPRLGEVLKCTILSKYEKVPPDKLIGTILVERTIDILCLLIVFAIALISQANIIGSYAKRVLLENFFRQDAQTLVIKFSIIIAALILGYWLLKLLFKKIGHYKFIIKIKSLLKGILAGINAVRYLKNKPAFIFHSILIWACYVGGTYLGFFVIDETSGLPFGATFPVLAFASIGMIITPGGIGTYPLFIMEVMLLYGIEEGFGFANGSLQWFAQFIIILIVGFISLLALPLYNKKLKRASGTSYSG